MKHFDRTLFITVILISLFGIVMIYSASSIWAEYKFHDAFKFVKAQSVFWIIGIIECLFLSKIPSSFWKEKANKIVFLCFLLLHFLQAQSVLVL